MKKIENVDMKTNEVPSNPKHYDEQAVLPETRLT